MTKQKYIFEIENYYIDETNVLGSDIKLKKFEYNEEKKDLLLLDEYEARFELFDIEGFKKSIDIIKKINKEARVLFILDYQIEGILQIETKNDKGNYNINLVGKGKANDSLVCGFSLEYLKGIVDSLNIKEIEKIEVYLKDDYPLGLIIINKDESKNKIILAPKVEV